MRIIILSIFSFMIVNNIYSQSIERSVVASSGQDLSNGDLSLNMTIGELVGTTIESASVVLTQGFQQTQVLLNIKVDPIVLLQGAMIGNGGSILMRDNLRGLNFIPTTSPYSDNLVCESSVFNNGGTNGLGTEEDNIVDWVFVELRDKSDNTNVIASKSALLQRDGDIVDIDGISSLTFPVEPDEYFIAVKHRNHLGVMTAASIALNNNATTVDFTDASNDISFGNFALSSLFMPSGKLGLWAGDLDGNGMVRFAGPGNDINLLKGVVLNHPSNISGSSFFPFNEYSNYDLNLNGQVRFAGPGNDSNILKNIIINYPANSTGSSFFPIFQQIPN